VKDFELCFRLLVKGLAEEIDHPEDYCCCWEIEKGKD
jgi:hypothetical protein